MTAHYDAMLVYGFPVSSHEHEGVHHCDRVLMLPMVEHIVVGAPNGCGPTQHMVGVVLRKLYDFTRDEGYIPAGDLVPEQRERKHLELIRQEIEPVVCGRTRLYLCGCRS